MPKQFFTWLLVSAPGVCSWCLLLFFFAWPLIKKQMFLQFSKVGQVQKPLFARVSGLRFSLDKAAISIKIAFNIKRKQGAYLVACSSVSASLITLKVKELGQVAWLRSSCTSPNFGRAWLSIFSTMVR
jgi:hypothetical protein